MEILVDESVFLYVWCGNGVPTPNINLFFSNTPLPIPTPLFFLAIHPCLPATNVQLSTKLDAFLSTNILLSLIIFFQPTVQYF